MKYVVRIDKLGEKIKLLEEKLDIVDANIMELNDLKSKIIWEGTARDKFNQNYDSHLEQLQSIEKELIDMLAFFKSFHSNYDEEYEKLKTKYKHLYDEIKEDIND